MEFSSTERSGQGALPDQFLEQVRQSLDHVYDLSFLLNKPLLFPQSGRRLAGKSLKIEMIRLIESLNPGPGFTLASREARPYHLLNLRYIQKMGIEEIASRLNISVRQAYRDLRAGEEQLAALLWASANRNGEDTAAGGAAAESDQSLNHELSRMPSNLQTIDLAEVINAAGKVTGELAYERQVHVNFDGLPQSIALTADPTVAQQVIVSLFSHSIRRAAPGSTIDVSFSAEPPSIRIQFQPDPQHAVQQPVSDVVYQLIERLNWSLSTAEPGPLKTISIDFQQNPKTILIVEDNEGVIELLRRYLTDQPVSIVSTNQSPEGLRLAQEMPFDLILLDVMMQDLDGWEFLRRLKRDPHTASIPVVVSSVFFEPDLARSLGAASFLPKPVTRQNLLRVLGEVGILQVGA